MNILIKGMNKPKSCVRHEDAFIITECEFMNDDWSCIFQTDCKSFPDEEEFKEQYNNCPLVEIDDELFQKAENAYVLQQIRCGERRNDEGVQ